MDSVVSERISLLSTTTRVADCVKDADIVIEAVIEDITLKRELFSEIQENCPR